MALYFCDQKSDFLRIEQFGAYNDLGEELLRRHSGIENLYRAVAESDTPGEDWRVVRRCQLSSGVFEIEMTPGIKVHGDGECGAWSTGWMRISGTGKDLYKSLMQRWCSSEEIISEIVVDGAPSRVDVTMMSTEEYYR